MCARVLTRNCVLAAMHVHTHSRNLQTCNLPERMHAVSPEHEAPSVVPQRTHARLPGCLATTASQYDGWPEGKRDGRNEGCNLDMHLSNTWA